VKNYEYLGHTIRHTEKHRFEDRPPWLSGKKVAKIPRYAQYFHSVPRYLLKMATIKGYMGMGQKIKCCKMYYN